MHPRIEYRGLLSCCYLLYQHLYYSLLFSRQLSITNNTRLLKKLINFISLQYYVCTVKTERSLQHISSFLHSLLPHFPPVSKLQRFHVAFRLGGVQSIESDLCRAGGGLRWRKQLRVDILDLDTSLVIGLVITRIKHQIWGLNARVSHLFLQS